MDIPELLKLVGLDDFVALDFETTGLDPAKDKIIEIGAVRFADGQPVEEFQQLVNPRELIPRFITDLTNISDDMVAGEPTIEECGQQFIDFVGNSPLVGQNIPFDFSFLKGVFTALEQATVPKYELYDTLPLARTFLYFHSGFSLGAQCEYFGIDHAAAHRAYNDALNTGTIFCNLVHEAASYPLPVIELLVSVQSHVKLENKALFSSLFQNMISSGAPGGLTVSKIPKHHGEAIFKRETDVAFQPVTATDFFGTDGTLAQNWPDYEPRPIQITFSDAVDNAFSNGETLVAEAGTGSGKSMAYLLPAINQSLTDSTPVVISCNTKHLQDQLFHSEVPRIATYLDAPLKVVLLKGRGNYLCKSRLEAVLNNAGKMLGPDDCAALMSIIIWSQFTRTGDIDECPGFSSRWRGRLWNMLRSERGFCLGNSCSRHSGCYLGPTRKAVKTANVIIVNHALLLADSSESRGLLPKEYFLIIDEAHNLGKVTVDQLTREFSSKAVSNLADNYIGNRYRQLFRKQLRDTFQVIGELEDLPDKIKRKCKAAVTVVENLMTAYKRMRQVEIDPNSRYNVQQGRYLEPSEEFAGLEEETDKVLATLLDLSANLQAAYDCIAQSEMVGIEAVMSDLENDLKEAIGLATAFATIAVKKASDDDVLWREIRNNQQGIQITFRCAPMLVGEFLRDHIFERRPGTILCSATLQVANSFSYFRSEVGLESDQCNWPVVEEDFPSPFLYREQCAVFHWEGGADVNDGNYTSDLANLIDDITDQIPRRLLVLFTSYAQMRAVHEGLYNRLHKSERKLITQFERGSRRGLLDAFRANPRSILFGTSSFWEGVDLPRDLVEVVIVARLPFANPHDPLVEARVDYLKEQGRNAFIEYQVPEAITRFRQGFGRLIRTSSDEGIFIVTDGRVSRRRYGQMFLDSLPVESQPFIYADKISSSIKNFLFVNR